MTRVEAFAVDADAVQLVWRAAPAGKVVVAVGDEEQVVDAESGPGSASISGLAPATNHVARVAWPGAAPVEVRFRTLQPPAGPVRARIATISDLHIGLRSFGYFGNIAEPSGVDEPLGVSCARASLAEAVEWGADIIVIKGDITNSGRRYEWAQAAALVHELPVPVVILPGNHESAWQRSIESWQAAEQFDLHVVRAVEAIDLPAIRLVLGTTVMPGHSRGRLEHRREALVAATEGSPAALVALHHQLERVPDLPLWPPGIPRAQADRFLDELAAVQPASLVTSGHTHRHRRRQHGPITVTQVGSTKDYPGVWAGYTVHDSGITQVVRRVADPACLRWTDRTRAAAAGMWATMSQGSLAARCFSVEWTRPAR